MMRTTPMSTPKTSQPAVRGRGRRKGCPIARVLLGLSVGLAGAAHAQMTPVGTWISVDDSTGKPSSQVRIEAHGDALSGRVEQVLKDGADPKAVCSKCSDDRKDKPIVGLEIIRGAKQTAGAEVWEGGRILDPEKGSDYRLRLTPIEGGAKLQVRGSLGPFSRTQVWQRVK